jgi:hypothetical protein
MQLGTVDGVATFGMATAAKIAAAAGAGDRDIRRLAAPQSVPMTQFCEVGRMDLSDQHVS